MNWIHTEYKMQMLEKRQFSQCNLTETKKLKISLNEAVSISCVINAELWIFPGVDLRSSSLKLRANIWDIYIFIEHFSKKNINSIAVHRIIIMS